ncbi:MAG: DUF938 domain-containing protein [Kofleriaceae bacterium]
MKRHSPAAERNRAPILEVLRRVLPTHGRVLELASGSGQHAVAFASALPGITWQPSDPDADARASIAAWRAEAALPNLAAPLDLDVTAPAWPVDPVDAVVAVNLVHISPWAATEALFAGAARVLRPGGVVVLYGPYRIDGDTAPSNLAFDADLRARDPAWGVRELREVVAAADGCGLALAEVIAMPANNHVVVLRPHARAATT